MLLSDAGTPLIADPGESLIRACVKENLSFTALPGACSVINALVLSGFSSSVFQFRGFLKRKAGELKKQLLKMLAYRGTSIIFETAKRLLSSLKMIDTLDPQRQLTVAREMTKMFEEIAKGRAKDLIEHFSKRPIKGEIVLLMEEKEFPLENLALEELLETLKEQFALSNKEALKMAAKILNKKKSDLYKKSLIGKNKQDKF